MFISLAAQIFGVAPWVFWLVIAALALVVEVATVMLVSLWFVIGALAALIASLCGASLLVQVLLFVLLSLLTLLIGFRYRDRLNVGRHNRTATNADRLIGMEGLVVQEINGITGKGQVRVGSELWSARSAGDASFNAPEAESVIAEGRHVRVLRIEGAKLIVRELPDPSGSI